jgi:hypothetical protein
MLDDMMAYHVHQLLEAALEEVEEAGPHFAAGARRLSVPMYSASRLYVRIVAAETGDPPARVRFMSRKASRASDSSLSLSRPAIGTTAQVPSSRQPEPQPPAMSPTGSPRTPHCIAASFPRQGTSALRTVALAG